MGKWVMIERAVQLCHLILLVLLLLLLSSGYKQGVDAQNFTAKIDLFKKDTAKLIENNLQYVEGRVNKLQEGQDGYQVANSKELYLLKERLKILESSKGNARVVNTNNNTLIVEGHKKDVVEKEQIK